MRNRNNMKESQLAIIIYRHFCACIKKKPKYPNNWQTLYANAHAIVLVKHERNKRKRTFIRMGEIHHRLFNKLTRYHFEERGKYIFLFITKWFVISVTIHKTTMKNTKQTQNGNKTEKMES